jgi:hypothetical protein
MRPLLVLLLCMRPLLVLLLAWCQLQQAGSLLPSAVLSLDDTDRLWAPRCAARYAAPRVWLHAGPVGSEDRELEPGALSRIAGRLSLQTPRDGMRRLLGINETLHGDGTPGARVYGASWVTGNVSELGARVGRRLASIRGSRRIASMRLLLRNATQWEEQELGRSSAARMEQGEWLAPGALMPQKLMGQPFLKSPLYCDFTFSAFQDNNFREFVQGPSASLGPWRSWAGGAEQVFARRQPRHRGHPQAPPRRWTRAPSRAHRTGWLSWSSR